MYGWMKWSGVSNLKEKSAYLGGRKVYLATYIGIEAQLELFF